MIPSSTPKLSFWQRLTAPHPSVVDIGERRRASLLANIGLVLFPIMLAAALLGTFYRILGNAGESSIAPSFALAIAFLFVYLLARSVYYRVGAVFLALFFIFIAAILVIAQPTSIHEALYSVFPIMFVISIALFNQRGMWLLFASVWIGLAVAFFAIWPVEMRIVFQIFGITGSIAILAVIVVRFREGIERERLTDLQSSNQELIAIKEKLEERVQERTRDLNVRIAESDRRSRRLETVSTVARIVASIQDLDRLLPTITEVVSEQFGFYHSGIFLINQEIGYAILRAANSEGGQRMLKRGHRLRIGTAGIVGFVAAQGEPRIALNVGADAVYFNNPDLPNTRSEAALPLKIGSQSIGVLDVQSTETNAFQQEDIYILGILANQIAVAIENARLFSQTRQALDESQATYEEYVRQDWARFARRIETKGFSYDGIKTAALSSSPSKPDDQTTVVPVRIRGLVIGDIHIRANDPSRRWTPDELSLVQAAADRAGLAIENVRLLGEAQRRAAKERAIGDITSKIAASIDMESILQTAVEELGRSLPGSEIILQFQKKD